VLVFPVISIFEAWVAELQELHDDTDGEGIGQFSGVWSLFVDLGAGLHPGA